MSTALVTPYYELDLLSKNFNSHKHIKISERKSVPNYTVRRSSTSGSSNSSCSSPPNNKVNNANTENSTVTNNQTHRKLDRSLSEPVDRNSGQQQQQQRNNQANSSRYKTELCRPFEESGKCKYGDKCQFAHGANELRTLARHPKYKTELCRTFHTIGFCPYGPRCHFIHNAELSLEGMFRPKALSISSFGTGSTSSGDSNASSLSESPTNVGGGFSCEDIFSNTPVTTPTANNAFTFNSQDFSFLISSTSVPLSPSKRVQQQNAYNTALNQFTLLFNQQQRNNNNNNNLNINDLDTVFTSDSVPVIAVPSNLEPHPSSPVESAASDMDNLSLCGSPPADSAVDPRNPLRLPIFSRLSTSED